MGLPKEYRTNIDAVLIAPCSYCNQETLEVIETVTLPKTKKIFAPEKFIMRRMKCSCCGNKEALYGKGYNDLYPQIDRSYEKMKTLNGLIHANYD